MKTFLYAEHLAVVQKNFLSVQIESSHLNH